MTRRYSVQALKHDMDKADEADKRSDLHGNEQEEPASTTRTRQKASEAVDKVCCTCSPLLTARQAGAPCLWLAQGTVCSSVEPGHQ